VLEYLSPPTVPARVWRYALRTADSGYLTRRLVDVSQDVDHPRRGLRHRGVHREPGVPARGQPENRKLRPNGEINGDLVGRIAARDLKTKRGRVIVEKGKEIDRAEAGRSGRGLAGRH